MVVFKKKDHIKNDHIKKDQIKKGHILKKFRESNFKN